MNNFRKLTLLKISTGPGVLSVLTSQVSADPNYIISAPIVVNHDTLKNAGTLTDFVQEHMGTTTGNFRAKFLKLPPGEARETLVYEEIIKRNKLPKMVPITVNGPEGTGIKITYNVMTDYIMLDGMRVPMSGSTAQKVADHFKMNLLTPKMSKQVWDNADIKINPMPLSASGFEYEGKFYSKEEVVARMIGDPRAALVHSQNIDKKLKGRKGLMAGPNKDIVMPHGDTAKLHLWGLYSEQGTPIEDSKQTGHDTKVHSEYLTNVRLAGNKAVITYPDGRTEPTTVDKIMNDPDMYQALSDSQGIKKYQY